MNMITIVIWLVIYCCIAFAFDLKVALNPIRNYKKWTSSNTDKKKNEVKKPIKKKTIRNVHKKK